MQEPLPFGLMSLPTRADAVSNCKQAAAKGSPNNPELRDSYVVLQVHLHVHFHNLGVSVGEKCHLTAETELRLL